MIQTVPKHWRFLLLLLLLDLLLLAGLALPGRVRRLTETVWTVRLVAGCEMDYHTSIHTVALACPGVGLHAAAAAAGGAAVAEHA